MLSRPAARLRRSVATALVIGLVAGAAPAGAQPSSNEVRNRLQQAQDRLDEIEEEVSAAVEDYNEAQAALDEITGELGDTQSKLDRLAIELTTASDAVADHVRRLHKLGPTLELSSVVVAADATDAGARLAVLRRILNSQQADVQGLAALRTSQTTLQARLVEARAEAEQRTAELEQRRERLEATVASHETEMSRLQQQLSEAIDREEAERRRREEARRARAATQREAARQQQQAARPQQQAAARTAAAPATRKSAQVAIDLAMAQIGKPYRYGGGGPNSFDCSGLTSFAWRAAGVSLPHGSRAQYAATTRISRSELQPGDLVFYHSPISHVAMYIGGNKVVEAPYSGNNVRIRHDGLTRRGIVGYGRP